MTKRLFYALLAVTLMGGLLACNKQTTNDLNPEGQSTGDTYMSVAFSTANPNTARAAEDPSFNSIGNYIGRDKIKDVTVYVIDASTDAITKETFTTVTDNPDGNADTQDFRTEAWKTTAGDKIVYVYVNIAGTPIKDALDAATNKTAFEAANKDAYALVASGAVKDAYAQFDGTNDIIAMSCVEPMPLTVNPGVSKSDAEAGTDNRADLTVRRLVAQAAVTTSADKFEVKDASDNTLITFNDLKWDVMQYEQSTYLMPQPTAAGADATRVEFCKTPSFEFIPTATNYTTDAGTKYAYRAFDGTEVSTLAATANDAAKIAAIVATPMRFITETTHLKGGKLATDGGSAPFTGYRKGNTTYVIISAKITPSGTAWATGEEAKSGDDLFYGVQDKKFYKDEAVAKANNEPSTAFTDGRDNVIKYTGGLCYYVAWLNPDNVGDPTVSPIIRNNIYHLNIKLIKSLGYSGNPLNPNGDNPQDPDDKTPKPEETLYPVNTYMAVTVTIINWGVHSHDIEF